MSKQDVEVKAPATQVAGLKVAFTSVCMAASLLFDVYVMINHSELVWLMGITSLVFLAAVYFFVNSILVLKYATQVREEEMYDDLFKSSKATYLMMKKYFDDVQEQLDDIMDKAGIPQEEIINAQKSIAKVTISRNKENADALMNSNDKLLDKIFDFEDALSKIDAKIAENQKGLSDEKLQEVMMKQQELANLVKEIEVSLKKEILSINTKIQSQPAPVMMAAPTMMPAQGYVPNMTTEMPLVQESISEEKLDELVEKANEEMNLEMAEMPEEEMSSPADVISFEQEEKSEPLEELTEELPNMEDLAKTLEGLDLDLEAEAEAEVDVEDVLANLDLAMDEEPAAEQKTYIEVEEAVAEPEPEPVVEEVVAEPEPEPVVEEVVAEPEPAAEVPPMPDLSDPNHVMTPDEIAALLANAGTESVAQPEPEPEPEPVVEEPAAETPPMPDLSDPNHVMTPDEIAALLANM